MFIPTLKMPSIRQLWQLVQQGDYAFSFDDKDTYLHIPIVKMPTIRQVWQLIQGDYAFSFHNKGTYLHIPIVKCHHHFLWFVWQHKPPSVEDFIIWVATASRVKMPTVNSTR